MLLIDSSPDLLQARRRRRDSAPRADRRPFWQVSLLLLLFAILTALPRPLRAENLEIQRQREYFRQWFGPMSAETVRRMWKEVNAMPSESPAESPTSVNSWQLLGPLYNVNPGGGQMTGRVRDIDATNVRVLAASGGLWRFYFGPVAMNEQVPASWFGSFATNPADPNTILLGTGEYGQGYGTGLYKTTDAGVTWTHVSLGGDPSWFSRVRWNVNGTIAYAASDHGIDRSTDGGTTWTRVLSGDATDVAPVPASYYANLVYAAIYNNGLWRSSDGGATWVQMGGGLPTTGTGHGAVSAMDIPGTPVSIYVSFVSAGVWRTFDGGVTWTSITPSPDINRSWYANAIAVSPVSPQRVFLGGVGARWSSNGGTTWNSMVNANLHADYHVFAFDPGGTGVWAGNDGGWSHSSDLGLTWDSSTNVMPITQFYDVACERTEVGMMVGASQDNNVEYSPDESLIWNLPPIGSTEGDGNGAAVDQFTPTRLWAIQGVYGGSYSYHRSRSTDGGATWTEIDNGIDPNTTAGRIREDGVFNPWLVTNAGAYVYDSTNFGSTWTRSNATAFPGNVNELTCSARATPNAVAYACIGSNTPGQRLYVRDGGVWQERDSGLPAGVSVRTVATHPYSGNYVDEAWALMNGTGTPGAKVFHTTNRGVTWTNITGNLPDVPMGGLAPDPHNTNYLFLGTALGCFKSTDGGASWTGWNNGLSAGVMVTVMSTIDTRGSGGPLYIVAGTYGRSTFKRDASGDDPISSAPLVLATDPARFRVDPNPLSDDARLEFVLGRAGRARIEIIDVTGRRVGTALDQVLPAGPHSVDLDGRGLAPGVWFFRLHGDDATAVRRAVVVR